MDTVYCKQIAGSMFSNLQIKKSSFKIFDQPSKSSSKRAPFYAFKRFINLRLSIDLSALTLSTWQGKFYGRCKLYGLSAFALTLGVVKALSLQSDTADHLWLYHLSIFPELYSGNNIHSFCNWGTWNAQGQHFYFSSFRIQTFDRLISGGYIQHIHWIFREFEFRSQVTLESKSLTQA